jgi:molybdenum cofactor cytidylyltransferase
MARVGQSSAVRVAAVVLAAGRSSRMPTQKLLLRLGERSVVQWVVDATLASAVVETVVVVGHEAAGVRRELAGRAVTVVENPDHAEGMSTSLRAGLRLLSGRDAACDGALVLLGDQPFVSPVLLDRLIAAFASTGAQIVRPSVGDEPTNPVLMGASLFPELMAQRGDVGGREVVARHRDEVHLVPVDDPRLGLDVDTPEDYEAARMRCEAG